MMAYHKYKVILSRLSIIDASAARGGGVGVGANLIFVGFLLIYIQVE